MMKTILLLAEPTAVKITCAHVKDMFIERLYAPAILEPQRRNPRGHPRRSSLGHVAGGHVDKFPLRPAHKHGLST